MRLENTQGQTLEATDVRLDGQSVSFNTPAERAFIAAIAEIPHSVLAAIFLFQT